MPRRDSNEAAEGSTPVADGGGGGSAGSGGLSSNNQSRVCQDCGRVFSSGKAFGGHKRIHVQAAKKSQKLMNLVVNKNDLPNLDRQLVLAGSKDHKKNGVEEEVSCAICGKAFVSMKALFGHMRFHPDRGWRGVHPPNDVGLKAASSTSTLSDDRLHIDSSATTGSVLDLKNLLEGWSVTGKRGRKAIPPASSASGYGSGYGSGSGSGSRSGSYGIQEEDRDDNDDRLDENDMDEAVKDLLIFACGGSSQSDGNPKKKTAEEQKSSINGAGNKLNIKGDHTELESKDNGELNKMMKRKKKRRLCDLEREGEAVVTDQNNQGQHICITCNKPFPTHQALGGHRSSHNKLKNNVAKEPTVSGLNQETVLSEDQEVSTAANHQCNICNKTFRTGQALGGHMRRHWTAPTASAPAESQATSSSSEQQQPTTRIVRNFDLNELPSQEADD
ncbi:zinc finger protein ZAT9 [Carica papaya]|uniref:zinc finger protein ZAT9 n=1 Tax=Carica papaya TaxID=3649 RepID=UPI000B8CB10B|nr:zinc finger protein ZAT9 [Carica papaya]